MEPHVRLDTRRAEKVPEEDRSLLFARIGGSAARPGPASRRSEARPPRYKAGAVERSPSAPRLKPSIVNEQEDEAPRVKHSAPHSPDLASSEEVFGSSQELSASSEEPFAPRSPSLGPHSLPFESSEEGLEPRDLRFGRHSLRFGSPETSPRPIPRGECHPKRRERRPSSGECHPKSYTDDVPQMSHNPKPRECPASCWGMPSERPSGSSEEEGMPHKIQKKPRKLPQLPILAQLDPRRELTPLYAGWKESC